MHQHLDGPPRMDRKERYTLRSLCTRLVLSTSFSPPKGLIWGQKQGISKVFYLVAGARRLVLSMCDSLRIIVYARRKLVSYSVSKDP